ncbi:MAG: hypothetical protein HC888_01870 [Candidatus Competibacteraceae bacterium]|nr:hypothetical protein [Candidatus Competibacteraceae bacterium]
MIHASVLQLFTEHYGVSSVVAGATHYNSDYFMCDERCEEGGERRFFFEGVELFPVSSQTEKVGVQLLELARKFKPDLIVSIGGMDTAIVQPIKTLLEGLKWIAVVSESVTPLPKSMILPFEEADGVIATNFSLATVLDCQTTMFGPSLGYSLSEPEYRKEFRVISVLKNLQACNPWAVVETSRLAKTIVYMHISRYEPGDYDLKPLSEEPFVSLPQRFVSTEEGYSTIDLKDEYRRSAVVADLSLQASTGYSVLQGMRLGCLPLVSKANAIREIVEPLSNFESTFLVECVPLIGTRGEKLWVADPQDAANKLLRFKRLKDEDWMYFFYLQEECQRVSQRYSREAFELELESVMVRVQRQSSPRLKLAQI